MFLVNLIGFMFCLVIQFDIAFNSNNESRKKFDLVANQTARIYFTTYASINSTLTERSRQVGGRFFFMLAPIGALFN